MVVVAVISVQIGAAVAKQLFDAVGPSGAVFLRTSLSAVMFWLAWRPRLRYHNQSVYLNVVLYGAVITANMLVFYTAIERVPLGITVTIAFAGPLTLAVIGSRKATDFLWIVLAAVGILLLSPLTNVNIDPLGMALALLTAAMWATYILVTKRVSHLVDGNTLLVLAMALAAIIALPFGGAKAVKVLDNPTLILPALIVALLSAAIPFWLEFRAIKSLSPGVFGLLLSLEPAAAAIIGFLLLHEDLSLQKIIGIGLVTVAAAATARSGSH
jgi:inner membrane transporter RhtA